jgi:hypothetical protein
LGRRNIFPLPQLRLYVLHRKRKNLEESLLDLTIVTEVMVGDHLEAGGVIIIKETNNKMIDNKNFFIIINNPLSVIGVANSFIPLELIVALLGIELVRRKSNNLQTKENHLNLPTIVAHCNLSINEVLALLFLLEKTL